MKNTNPLLLNRGKSPMKKRIVFTVTVLGAALFLLLSLGSVLASERAASTSANEANLMVVNQAYAPYALNAAPVVSDVDKEGPEDNDIPFAATDFTDQFSDPDGDSLDTIEVLTLPDPSAGVLLKNGGEVTQNEVISATELGDLVFQPVENWNGFTSFDWNGADITGTYAITPASVNLTVTAENDPPINTVPSSQTTAEDTPLTFSSGNGNQVSVSDVDAGSNDVEIDLTANLGTLTLATVNNLSFSQGDGTDDPAMVFTGTIADVNTALDGMSFQPAQDYDGSSASLTIVTDDQGNTGSGGSQTDTDIVDITVTAVNDAPVNSLPPSPQSTDEGTSLVFSTDNGNEISISDLDAAGNEVEVTLSVGNGHFTLSGTVGLFFSTGDGIEDPTMAFTGTINDINDALNGLSFEPPQNFDGQTTLQITTNDQGFTGDGGPQEDSDSLDISVNGVNNPPVNSVPGPQETTEDTSLTFSAANGNQISVSDIDAGNNAIRITLETTNGTATLATIANLTFSEGDGTADSLMIFTGTITDVNTALDGMSFMPALNFNGTASIQITTNDQGNTGSGGSQTDTDSVDITVTAINDAPTNNLPPSPQSTNEETALVFSTDNGNPISISDPDAAGSQVKVTLSIENGHLTLSGTAGLSFSVGDGTEDSNMIFTGVINDINDALDGLTFEPPQNFDEQTTLQITTDDQGFTGDGGPKTDNDSLDVMVNGINDAPINTVPGPQTTAEDTPLTFSASNGNQIAISDIDAGDNSVKVVITATNGTITLDTLSGLSFEKGDGTDDDSVTFTGTITNVNNALNGMSFTPGANFNGAATLQITTNDQSNTGTGGPLSDTDVVNITVTPVNDRPTLSNVIVTGEEDSDVQFTAADFTSNFFDVDGDSLVKIKILSLPEADVGILKLNGNPVAVNDEILVGDIGGLVFSPQLNWNGEASFQWSGFDGTEYAAQSATAQVLIDLDAVNDPPVNNVPATQTIDEDTTLVFSPANGNRVSVIDVDAKNNAIQVDLTATQGLLTLDTTAGLTFSNGDGSADASMTFTGTIPAINTALNGLSYEPTSEFSGAATIQIVTNDLGHTGTGGPLSDTDTINITVSPVNDGPVNTVPGSQTTDEDSAVSFSAGNGNQISIDDIDAGSNPVEVTLTSEDGSFTLSGIAGLSFSTGDGTDDATMTFTGSIANINTALNGMSFTPALNFNGTATIRITTNDQGNTGSGGALSDTDTVDVTVNPINDPPELDLNGSGSGTGFTATFIEEQGPVAVVGADLVLNDVDNNNLQSLTVTLVNRPDGNAEVLAANTAGTNISANYSAGVLSLTGSDSVANYRTVLRTVTYNNTALPADKANRTIQFVASDGTQESETAVTTLLVREKPIYTLYLPTAIRGIPWPWDQQGEPNNEVCSSYPLDINRQYTNFLPNDAQDWYHFDLDQPGTVEIEVSNFVQTGQIAFYIGPDCASRTFLINNGDPSMTKIVRWTVTNEQAPNRFFIFVGTDPSEFRTTNPYSLIVRFTPAN